MKKRGIIAISTFYISALCGVITGVFSFFTTFLLKKIFKDKNG